MFSLYSGHKLDELVIQSPATYTADDFNGAAAVGVVFDSPSGPIEMVGDFGMAIGANYDQLFVHVKKVFEHGSDGDFDGDATWTLGLIITVALENIAVIYTKDV